MYFLKLSALMLMGALIFGSACGEREDKDKKDGKDSTLSQCTTVIVNGEETGKSGCGDPVPPVPEPTPEPGIKECRCGCSCGDVDSVNQLAGRLEAYDQGTDELMCIRPRPRPTPYPEPTPYPKPTPWPEPGPPDPCVARNTCHFEGQNTNTNTNTNDNTNGNTNGNTNDNGNTIVINVGQCNDGQIAPKTAEVLMLM